MMLSDEMLTGHTHSIEGRHVWRDLWFAVSVALAAVGLGLFTTSEHVSALGPGGLEGLQWTRLQSVLRGYAGDPWQYRVLPNFLLEHAIDLFQRLGFERPVRTAFYGFRWLQDSLIFLAAFFYYRRLGLSAVHAALGLSLLAWGISYANYDSDLQFSTYFDVLFYLLAGLIILHKKPIWLVPLSVAAALNRETSGLIPFLLLWSGSGNTRVSALALTMWAVTSIAVRAILPSQDLITIPGHSLGLGLLRYNLLRGITWHRLLATMGILPVVAVAGYGTWPPILKRFFWVVVPVWCVAHAFGAVMAESRLFLVPHALIIIPGALWLAQSRPAHA